jgi:hypothetical protein
MSQDFQTVSTILSFLTPQAFLGVVVALLMSVGIYVLEELGWPRFRSPRLERLYAKLTFTLTAAVSPLCFVLMTVFMFLWGLGL